MTDLPPGGTWETAVIVSFWEILMAQADGDRLVPRSDPVPGEPREIREVMHLTIEYRDLLNNRSTAGIRVGVEFPTTDVRDLRPVLFDATYA